MVEQDRPTPQNYVEEVEVRGHIIDSLLLPKILDCITTAGGSFRIKQIAVGQQRQDPSFALVDVSATSPAALVEILAAIGDHGAVPTHQQDAELEPSDIAGVFPEGFYSTTNQKTEIRLAGQWLPVADQEMDCGVTVDPASRAARCVPMSDVTLGMPIVVGHRGVRVFPHERQRQGQVFEFMSSNVSTEKPKGLAIRQIAREMHDNRRAGNEILVVGGPAIVHTGSGGHFCQLIRRGYVNRLFAGNALATHDINPSTAIKLSDRGSFQTVGLVTDVEPFLRSLVGELEVLEM